MSRRPTPPRPADGEPRATRAGSGRRGEDLAADWLRDRGYVIVARNLRTGLGEIDLLIRRRRHYAAVEVKTRRHHPAPEHLVTPQQLARIGRALRALAPHLRPRPRTLRIDVLAVRLLLDGTAEVRHFPAWRRL